MRSHHDWAESRGESDRRYGHGGVLVAHRLAAVRRLGSDSQQRSQWLVEEGEEHEHGRCWGLVRARLGHLNSDDVSLGAECLGRPEQLKRSKEAGLGQLEHFGQRAWSQETQRRV